MKRAYVDYYEGPAKLTRTPPGPIDNRPSWDQTSMLFALEPAGDHFGISAEGAVTIDEKGRSFFYLKDGGRRYLLKFDERHTPAQVAETLFTKYYREPA